MNKNALIRTAGILLLVMLILVTGVIILFNWNGMLLDDLMDDFTREIKACADVELIETQAEYGNLNGNGNNMNYFGAALVRTDDPSALDELVKKLSSSFDVAGYSEQIGTKIENKYLERPKLYYSTEPDGEGYYTVYFFNGAHPYSNPFDVKGH